MDVYAGSLSHASIHMYSRVSVFCLYCTCARVCLELPAVAVRKHGDAPDRPTDRGSPTLLRVEQDMDMYPNL
jgi:hypothetical protein